MPAPQRGLGQRNVRDQVADLLDLYRHVEVDLARPRPGHGLFFKSPQTSRKPGGGPKESHGYRLNKNLPVSE